MNPLRSMLVVLLGTACAISQFGPARAAPGSTGVGSVGRAPLPMVRFGAAQTAPSGTYAWPVRGPVIRPFEAPTTQYSAGHRGIDIGAPFGSRLVAAQDGTVAFSGWVAGSLFISIDHPGGVRTTYSWLSEATVKKGQKVRRGDPIGRTGHGHPDIAEPHLHFGARVGSTYIDPMLLLGTGSVVGLIHLAPLESAGTGGTRMR